MTTATLSTTAIPATDPLMQLLESLDGTQCAWLADVITERQARFQSTTRDGAICFAGSMQGIASLMLARAARKQFRCGPRALDLMAQYAQVACNNAEEWREFKVRYDTEDEEELTDYGAAMGTESALVEMLGAMRAHEAAPVRPSWADKGPPQREGEEGCDLDCGACCGTGAEINGRNCAECGGMGVLNIDSEQEFNAQHGERREE